jgi:hypothetical protein
VREMKRRFIWQSSLFSDPGSHWFRL